MPNQNNQRNLSPDAYTPLLFPEEQIRWMAFDLEIAKTLPDEFEDFKRYRPLGISCAATLSSDGDLSMWVEKDAPGNYAQKLTSQTARQLVEHLSAQAEAGCRIVTWNGLGFDFDILYEESAAHPDCKKLALQHTDMMFHVFCEKGYGLSLDKAAKGMGLEGKTEGMDGALAPRLWQAGEHQQVLEYLEQDVRTTLDLAVVCDKQRVLRWVSNTGRLQELKLTRGWLNVDQARKIPLADTSWMRNPWPREKFTGWLE